MNLPKDPFMKSQHVNIMLKANDMDLKTHCLSAGINMPDLEYKSGNAGIYYDPERRQFRT